MVSNTEADIFQRIIQPNQADLPEDLARDLLSWRFADSDRARMTELSGKASEGTLSPDECRELDSYLRVGHLLAIAHSKARQSLRRL
ncbi:MAG TPA: hypothetical protein VL282_00535 [Tepidisphaeraceae bacterium]|jgi:hypothetical protein|nr:hypothetical protein [Tepidisphaeraceae bacterium]